MTPKTRITPKTMRPIATATYHIASYSTLVTKGVDEGAGLLPMPCTPTKAKELLG
jgi:hypothetical protein